jgi:predicted CopG family antitoxin
MPQACLEGLKYLCAYAYAQMTKTISLSNEAYELLRRHKLATESFSDTVVRLARQGGRLSEVIGLYPELRGKTALTRLVRENRKRLDQLVAAH